MDKTNEFLRSLVHIDGVEGGVQWKSILEGMLDALIVIDQYGSIQYANESCRDMFGHDPSGLVGQNIKLLMPEPYRGEHDGYLAHYRETGETNILGQTREFPVVRLDGRQIDIELSVSQIQAAELGEPYFCGSIRDISARKNAERALAESERRFRAIFSQESQFVGLLHPDGTLLEANRSSLEAVGVGRDDVVGKPFWKGPWWRHSEKERQRLMAGIQEAASGESVRYQTTHQVTDGGIIDVDFSIKPFHEAEGKIVLLLIEGRDITDIKRAQQREVSMMRAFADIGESASLLAHEIKNPITAVNTALRAVARQLGEDEQAVLKELVERMQKLESIMKRTLSLARPLSMNCSETEVAVLLEGALELMRPQAQAKGIAFELVIAKDCPRLYVDPQLMEEVLTNLIVNAFSALGEGGTIRLEALLEGERIVIRVDDDGPGIPESILASLFKPFVSTKTNGTGLGLAIARKVVEAHGGDIEVHNSPLGGARFKIDLPALGL